MVPKANQPSLVLVELAPKVNNEQELCILGAEGKPIALKVGGAEEVEGVELAPMVYQSSAHQGKEEENKLLHQAAETQRCALESQPFSSFLPWSP